MEEDRKTGTDTTVGCSPRRTARQPFHAHLSLQHEYHHSYNPEFFNLQHIQDDVNIAYPSAALANMDHCLGFGWLKAVRLETNKFN